MVRHLLIMSLIFSTAISNALPNATRLNKGDVAPFTGVELSDDYASRVYKELNDLNQYKLLVSSLEETIKLHEENEDTYLKEITELKDQNVTLNTALEKSSSNNFWRDALWFVIGAAAAGTVTFAITRH